MPGRDIVGKVELIAEINAKGLHDDVKRILEGEKGAFNEAGQQSGEEYVKGLRDAYEKDEKNKLSNRLLADMEAVNKRLEEEGTRGGKAWSDSYARAIQQRLRQGGAFSDQDLRRMGAGFQDTSTIVDRLGNSVLKTDKDFQRYINTLRASSTVREHANRDTDLFARLLHNAAPDLATFRRQLEESSKGIGDLGNGMDEVNRRGNIFTRAIGSIDNKLRSFSRGSHDAEGDAQRFGSAVVRLTEHFGKLDEKIAKGFLPTGQRNNFVNAVALMLNALTKFGGEIGKIFSPITKLAQGPLNKLASMFGEVGKEGNTAANFIASLATALPSLVGLITSLGSAAGLASIAIGTLVSGVSGLAAAVTALAGAGIMGIVGALGALAPVALGAGAGLGVFALAVSEVHKTTKGVNLSIKQDQAAIKSARAEMANATPGTKAYADAHKKLTQALYDEHQQFKSLKSGIPQVGAQLQDFYHQIQSIAAANVFRNFKSDWQLLKPVLGEVKGLIAGIGTAVGHVVDQFSKMLAGPSFTAFMNELKNTLPTIVQNLGSAFTHAFSGMAGMFRALLPWGVKLSDAINNVARTFDNWANSARGQNSIANFMKTAWHDASDLWNILVEVGKALGEIISSGSQNAGTSFLDSILKSVTHFADYLKSGRGQAAMKNWFTDAKNMVTGLGHVVGAIAKVFDDLDTRAGRANFTSLLNGLGKVITIAGQFISALDQIGQSLVQFARDMDIGAVLNIATGALQGVAGAFRLLADAVKPVFDFIAAHQTTFKVLAVGLGALWAAAKGYTILRAMALGIGNLASSFVTLTGARISIAGDAIQKFGNNVGGLGGKLTSGLGARIANFGNSFNGIAGKAQAAAQGITVAFAGLAVGTVFQQMTQHASKATQALSTLGGAVTGGAMGLAMSGGNPLMGAIGAVSGALPGLIQLIFGASQADQQWASDMQTVTSALMANKGAIDSNVKSLEAKALQDQGVLDLATKYGIQTNVVTQAALNNKNAQAELNKELTASIANHTQLFVAQNKMSGSLSKWHISQTQVNNAIKNGGPALANLDAKLAHMSDLTPNKAAIAFQNFLDSAASGFGKLSSKVGDSASKISDTVRKAQQLNAAMKPLHTSVANTAEATAHYAQQAAHLNKTNSDVASSLNQFQSALVTMKSQLGQTKGQLTGMSAAAVNNRGALMNVISAINQHIAVMKTQGASAGVVRAAIAGDVTQLQAAGRAAGLSKQQISEYTAMIKGIPPEAKTTITADTTNAESEIQKVIDSLAGIHDKTVYINAVTNVSHALALQHQLGAEGGVYAGANRMIIGEAGPEALVPLRRPLAMVNPAVRDLAAYAQGRPQVNNQAAQKVQNITVNVYPNSADPEAAAAHVINRMVALTRG